MSMKCTLCMTRYSLSTPQPDSTGALVFMCIECAAQHARPKRFAEGTMQPVGPANDFADRFVANDNEQAHQLELAQGKVAVLLTMLQRILDNFPELRWGLTSAVQQQTLRDARAVMEECK